MSLRFAPSIATLILPLLAVGCDSDEHVASHAQAGAGGAGAASKTTFFVTSDTNLTADLGGLSGADARCQSLASAAALGAHHFHAYLSAEQDPADASKSVNARDRIGPGPWYNSKGILLAQDLTTLHA